MPGRSGSPGGGGLLLPPLQAQQQLLPSSDEVKVFKDEGEQDQEEFNASESLQAELLGEKSGGWLYEASPDSLTRAPPPPGFPWGVPPLGHPHLPSLYPPAASSLYSLGAELYNQQLAQAWRGAPPGYYLPPPPLLPPGYPAPHPHHPHAHLPPGHPGALNLHDKEHGALRPNSPRKKEPHIKKPLNAFMLFMKEMRPVVQAECTLKESAAINQVLGRRWHNLSRQEQAEYYERARQERAKHMELYPDWNARDNYRHNSEARQKKKKRKLEKMSDPAAGMKKCRARYGVDQMDLWCQPCKRKKKCVRVQMYLAKQQEGGEHTDQDLDDPDSQIPEGSPQGSDGEAGSPGSGFSDQGSSGGGSPDPRDWSCSPLSPLMPPPSLAPPMRPLRVGNDPRDSNNPLSVSSLTNSYKLESPIDFSSQI